MISEEYKKMVLALPEKFFENWKWQAGDDAVIILNNKIIVFLWKTEKDIWKNEKVVWYYNYNPLFSNEACSSLNYPSVNEGDS